VFSETTRLAAFEKSFTNTANIEFEVFEIGGSAAVLFGERMRGVRQMILSPTLERAIRKAASLAAYEAELDELTFPSR
jgi:hypothetical protein